MRIAELSRRSGVAVASIKYYVREGLLASGETVTYNRVEYAGTHLQRLRLIRALLETGELSVAAAREVLAAVDRRRTRPHSVLGLAQRALGVRSVDDVLTAAESLGYPDLMDLVAPYRAAARSLADRELAWVAAAGQDRDTLTERAVVGTVLGDALLDAVRREAQRDASRARFQTKTATARGGPSPGS